MSPRSTTKAEPRAPSRLGRCDCGGIVGPLLERDLPPGVCFPLDATAGLPPMRPDAAAVHRAEHPNRYVEVILRQCGTCRQIYAQWLESMRGRRLDGSSFEVTKGNLGPVCREYIPRTVADGADEIPSTDDAYLDDPATADRYQRARRALLTEIAAKRLSKRAIAERLFELSDGFPAKARTLVAEATWFAKRAELAGDKPLGSAEKAPGRPVEPSALSQIPKDELPPEDSMAAGFLCDPTPSRSEPGPDGSPAPGAPVPEPDQEPGQNGGDDFPF